MARRSYELWATATDTEYGTTAERFSYHLCPDCDCLSIDPLPADRLREIYPPTYYSFADGATVPGSCCASRSGSTTQLSRDVDRPGTGRPRILDVGGGMGEVSSIFVRQRWGRRALVVDPDPASIVVGRSRGVDGFAGTIEEFDTSERFDLVLMLNLIEHVADPVAVGSRRGELLARGGLIWFQTPNFRALDGASLPPP